MSKTNVVRMAVDVPGVSDEDVMRHLEQATAEQESAPPQAFTSLADLFRQEAQDLNGDYIPNPDVAGMSVHITGALAVQTQWAEAEKRYRSSHKDIKGKDPVPAQGRLRIEAEGYYDGHGVKGWRYADGFPDPWEFNRENFIKMYMASWRFRQFVEKQWMTLSGTQQRVREHLRGE